MNTAPERTQAARPPLGRPGQPAALIVRGRVATLAGAVGFGWVEAIAIAGGRVVAAGSRAEVEALAGPRTRIVDAAPDEIVIPAFTDAHLHLAEAALIAAQLDLRPARTLADALALVARRHRDLGEGGDWLLGFGWQGPRFGREPTAEDLDAVAPGRPVFLWSHDRHAAWLSSPAIVRAGLADSADPNDGRFDRDATGRPTGVLREGAIRLATGALPAVAGGPLEAAIEQYAATLPGLGILAVHDPGPLTADPDLGLDAAACAALAGRGRLPVRVYVSVRDDSLEAAIGRGLRSGDTLLPDAPPDVADRCRVGWLKLFADGALGSRTAALLAPYEPGAAPPGGDRGILTIAPDSLCAIVARADAHGIASQVHAIGDAAVRAALDAFAALRERHAPAQADAVEGLRPRIEHAQLVDPADLPRFAQLGVVASVQPSHLATDTAGALAAWGERADRLGYPYRSLLEAGAVLAFGSDAPVEPADPAASLAFAIHRAAAPGAGPVLAAAQRLGPAEALRGACLGPALAAGERDGGRLTPGSRGDLLIVPARTIGDAPAAARPRLLYAAGAEIG